MNQASAHQVRQVGGSIRSLDLRCVQKSFWWLHGLALDADQKSSRAFSHFVPNCRIGQWRV